MSKVPTEDLVVAARHLDQNYHAIIGAPAWETSARDPADWRSYVSKTVRAMWGKLDYGERLAVFVTAASIAATRKKPSA